MGWGGGRGADIERELLEGWRNDHVPNENPSKPVETESRRTARNLLQPRESRVDLGSGIRGDAGTRDKSVIDAGRTHDVVRVASAIALVHSERRVDRVRRDGDQLAYLTVLGHRGHRRLCMDRLAIRR